MIADSLTKTSGATSKQNDTLEFIIEAFDTLSYENSMNYISRVKTQQVFKQCKIVPDTETERNIAKEREKFETILQNECHYYLNNYGTPEKQVIHYERNNQYEKAYE